MSHSECLATRVTLAINLELTHGRHGASARLELHERLGGKVALLTLRGWVDRIALRRLDQMLADLATREPDRLVLDCSQLRHIDYRLLPGLLASLDRFETGRVMVCGLSHHLRELFRFAGSRPSLHCWPSAAELLARPAALEPEREWAS